MIELNKYAKKLIMPLMAVALIGCSSANRNNEINELYQLVSRQEKFGSYLATIDSAQYQVLTRNDSGVKTLEIEIHNKGLLIRRFVDRNLDYTLDENAIPILMDTKQTFNGKTRNYKFLPSENKAEINLEYLKSVKKVLGNIKDSKSKI